MSNQYFDFIRNVWKLLSADDQKRMATLWQGYERVLGSIYQKFVEAGYGTTVNKVFTYADERWLPYTFDDTNLVNTSATYKTSQDLFLGINLSQKNTIKVSWDNNAPIEINIAGTNPSNTTIDEIVLKINNKVGFKFVVAVDKALLLFTSPTKGVNSKITFYLPDNPTQDASEIVLGIYYLPFTNPGFSYKYLLPYNKLTSIPVLQDNVLDDKISVTLIENTDYVITREGNTSYINFLQQPPITNFWAKRNLFDNEYLWNNFGFQMDVYQTSSPHYAQIIQGLWFAFWTGPRPENIRKALYLLFELPVAPFKGVITKITSNEISVTDINGVTEILAIPSELEPDVIVGQEVEIYTPLVTGIDVLDKVNYPGFITEEIGRANIQKYLTPNASRGFNENTDESKALKLLEEYSFLVQVSVNAFITGVNLANIKSFLVDIKPVTRDFFFQVVAGVFKDLLSPQEYISLNINIDVTPNLDNNESTFLLPEDLLLNETFDGDLLLLDPESLNVHDKTEILVYAGNVLVDTI